MTLDFYRVFPWDPKVTNNFAPGGPFFVPRTKQGSGRHDIPHLDGILYASMEPISAIAEHIQGFRGLKLEAADLQRPDELVYALLHFQLPDSIKLADLDDPKTLVALKVRPSQIATRNRQITREIAERIFNAGAAGLLWPSALESSWINVSLFFSRVKTSVSLAAPIQPLTLQLPELIAAAETLNIGI